MWSHDIIILPNSFDMALERLHATERMILESDKQKEYKKTIMDFKYRG